MPSRYADIFFGPNTKLRQKKVNSDIAYASGDFDGTKLEPSHQGLIGAQKHFFMATVSPSGWPYIQHRGGPKGFVHIIDDRTLAFPDYEGNEQYVTTGNIDSGSKVALFFIDYSSRTRIKVFGTAEVVDGDCEFIESMKIVPSGKIKSPCRRAIRVNVETYDANCRKYITPLYDREYLEASIEGYRSDLVKVREELEEARREIARLAKA